MILIGVKEIDMKEIKNKIKRNRFHIPVITFLICLWIFCFISIDWEEVNEYEEQWGGKITGQCPPQRPYMYHTLILVLIPFILFMYIFMHILIFYCDCDKQDKHENK